MAILIIDPSVNDRQQLMTAVKWVDSRRRFTFADNGASGFATALKNRPDLVFCERYLPDVAGEQLCAQLRERLANTTFVAYTNDTEKVERGLEPAVFHSVLPKPPCRWRTHAILLQAKSDTRARHNESHKNKSRRIPAPVLRHINITVGIVKDRFRFTVPMVEGSTVGLALERLGKQPRYFVLKRRGQEVEANVTTILQDADELLFSQGEYVG